MLSTDPCKTRETLLLACWSEETNMGDLLKVLIVGWLLKRMLPVLLVIGLIVVLLIAL
jgi:hypothetical protein